jgi:hypothetical protein
VNFYYFYCLDEEFGPCFIKFCSYFPYTAKLCINGHEYLKCQLQRRAIGYEALDNGISWCEDVGAAQRICDRFDEQKIEAFFRKWLRRLPHPFSAKDRRAGYREINDSQREVWRKSIEVFEDGRSAPRMVALFAEDQTVPEVAISNCVSTDTTWAVREIAATQRLNMRAKSDRTYHLLVSLRAGENPDAQTLRVIEERFCKELLRRNKRLAESGSMIRASGQESKARSMPGSRTLVPTSM